MRIIFATLPLDGHVAPLIPVAKAAKGAGHDVVIASCPGFERRIEPHGIEFHAVGPRWRSPEIALVAREAMSRNDLRFFVGKLFAEAAGTRMVPDMIELIRSWRADVVVRESSEFASWAAAEACDVPFATVGYGQQAFLATLGEQVIADINSVRVAAGLSADPDLSSLNRYLDLLFAPPGYQPATVPLSASARLLQPERLHPGVASLPDWLDELPDRPTVNGTLGTVYNKTPGLFEAMIDAARELDINLVLTTGRDRDPSEFGTLPPNVRAERFIPTQLLLDRCDALIAHAGYGTTMAGLLSATPMVLIPLGADQPLHAASCAQLRVAINLGIKQFTGRNVAQALRSLLEDPTYRRSAESVRESIDRLPPLESAIDLLEALASS